MLPPVLLGPFEVGSNLLGLRVDGRVLIYRTLPMGLLDPGFARGVV